MQPWLYLLNIYLAALFNAARYSKTNHPTNLEQFCDIFLNIIIPTTGVKCILILIKKFIEKIEVCVNNNCEMSKVIILSIASDNN